MLSLSLRDALPKSFPSTRTHSSRLTGNIGTRHLLSSLPDVAAPAGHGLRFARWHPLPVSQITAPAEGQPTSSPRCAYISLEGSRSIDALRISGCYSREPQTTTTLVAPQHAADYYGRGDLGATLFSRKCLSFTHRYIFGVTAFHEAQTVNFLNLFN